MGGLMRRRVLLLLVAAAICGLPIEASHAVARCLYISGTADALRKEKAVEDAQVALQDAINKWKTDNGITGEVKQTAQKPEPHPYWRSTVSPELFLPPDTITDTTYTVCWKGVVSPVVCTAAAQVCW
jgi:hypothetical protein